MESEATATCFLCKEGVKDSEDVVAVKPMDNRAVHRACLKCRGCDVAITGTCLTVGEVMYCDQACYRQADCSHCCCGCSELISEGRFLETAMGKFHEACFTCSVCSRRPEKGENYMVREQKLFCESHAQVGEDDQLEKVKAEGEAEAEAEEKSKPEGGKRRVPRTTIKPHQQEILMNVFNTNPKPNRLKREQLAKETGLQMRVIQVWFQNKRSKEKRLRCTMQHPRMQFRHQAAYPIPPPNAVIFPYTGPNYQEQAMPLYQPYYQPYPAAQEQQLQLSYTPSQPMERFNGAAEFYPPLTPSPDLTTIQVPSPGENKSEEGGLGIQLAMDALLTEPFPSPAPEFDMDETWPEGGTRSIQSESFIKSQC